MIAEKSVVSQVIDDLVQQSEYKEHQTMFEATRSLLRHSMKFICPPVPLFDKQPRPYQLAGMCFPYQVFTIELPALVILVQSVIDPDIDTFARVNDPPTFLQGTVKGSERAIQLGERMSGSMLMFRKQTSGKWVLCPYTMIVGREGEGKEEVWAGAPLAPEVPERMDDDQAEVYGHAVGIALDFLSLLACKNILHERVSAPPLRKQMRAMAEGRAPLYDFHVLKIRSDSKEPRGEHLGGTHATPRLHWVRGHIRHYATGNQTYVRPHTRGDPALGAVDKTYEVML